MLRKGVYDDVSPAGWGHLDDITAMTMGLGIYKAMEGIKLRIKGECYIPHLVICNALFFPDASGLGEESYFSPQEGLFKDPGLLQLMGCAARVIREGFDSSRNKGEHKPFHVDSIRYFQNRIPEAELERAWPQTVQPIAIALKGKDGVFIMDATKQLVYGDYEGARRKMEGAPGNPIDEIAYVELNGSVIESLSIKNSAPLPKDPKIGYRMMAIEVQDMDKAIAYLKNKDVEISQEPRNLGKSKRAEMRDPDGITIELRQW